MKWCESHCIFHSWTLIHSHPLPPKLSKPPGPLGNGLVTAQPGTLRAMVGISSNSHAFRRKMKTAAPSSFGEGIRPQFGVVCMACHTPWIHLYSTAHRQIRKTEVSFGSEAFQVPFCPEETDIRFDQGPIPGAHV